MSLVTQENISLCFPKVDARSIGQLCQQSLEETGKTALETAIAWNRPADQCLAMITRPQNEEDIRALTKGQHGVIFVIPHLGNWEMLNHYLGSEFGLTHMYQKNRHAALEKFIQSGRNQTGTKFVTTDPGGVRKQLATLRAGGCIGTMPDQEPQIHTGQFTPFFNCEALTSTLIPRMWLRSGASVVIASCLRSEKTQPKPFEIKLIPVGCPDDPVPRDTKTATSDINDAMEKLILTRPDQYLWSYKRFRTRPLGDPDRYQAAFSPVIHGFQKLALQAGLAISSKLDHKLRTKLADTCLNFAAGPATKLYIQAEKNLTLCQPDLDQHYRQDLIRRSLLGHFYRTLETGHIWRSSQQDLTENLLSVEGLENLPIENGRLNRGLILLTPPLGMREILYRYFANRFSLTEYYHPNSDPAVDNIIRLQRHADGIRLADHSRQGTDYCIRQLLNDQMVTICPDQQPRLRGGLFVPFFHQPALTATALSRMILESQAVVVFGVVLEESSGYRMHLLPCSIPSHLSSDFSILKEINQQLELIIRQHPDQYRWHDKRFNIRPAGHTKIY